ncbi:MAG: tRNA-dihydrouridine synthase [Planctomycetes bacterium]|nr:tRNA-dihydrouridine synthase [Planctomycetota bacterium]
MQPALAELRLGSHVLSGPFGLSPMAQFTCWPLRVLCQEHGASFSCTEMVKARFVVEGDPETMRILERHPSERLCGGQICGADEEELAGAARILTRELGFPFVDFNIACPIRRIVSDGAGGGLLADPPKVERLVRVLRDAADPAPVTVKMRSGLDEANITAVEVARAAEAGGAAMIALHPRTVRQAYGGKADHAIVEAVAKAVRVPVVGGGDVRSAPEAVAMLRDRGCALVYFARAATGDPWIFARAQALLETGAEPPLPDAREVCAVFRRHLDMLIEHLGEETACRHARRLAKDYAAHLQPPEAREAFYAALCQLSTREQAEAALARFGGGA